MNDFVSTQFTEPESEGSIKNDGWFPDIKLEDVRDELRLDGTVTVERLKPAVIAAIIHVNKELSLFKQSKQLLGVADLSGVEADKVNDESVLVADYRRAVFCTVKADLIERFRDFDSTAEGNKKVELLVDSAGEQRRNAQWAIQNIKGEPHMTVELI